MKRLTTMLAGAVLALGAQLSHAFPDKPIRLIVPYPPGTGTDTLARYTARQLEAKLGQPVIAENRPGASGIIATQTVVSAAPDGYTLLLAANAPVATNVAAFAKLPYDPLVDLAPVAVLAQAPMGFYVYQDSPYKTVADLVAAARKDPKKLNYGAGSATYQIATEWFLSLAQASANGISYKGAGPALNDLAGKQVDFVIAEYSGAQALVQAGKLRLLAVATDKRLASAPDVPTLQELGFKDFFKVAWWAMFAPAKTPAPVVKTLQDALLEIYADPKTQAFLAQSNFISFIGDAAALAKFQKKEIELEIATAQSANIPKQ